MFKRDELSRKKMGTLQQWVVGMIYIGDDKNPPLRLRLAVAHFCSSAHVHHRTSYCALKVKTPTASQAHTHICTHAST